MSEEKEHKEVMINASLRRNNELITVGEQAGIETEKSPVHWSPVSLTSPRATIPTATTPPASSANPNDSFTQQQQQEQTDTPPWCESLARKVGTNATWTFLDNDRLDEVPLTPSCPNDGLRDNDNCTTTATRFPCTLSESGSATGMMMTPGVWLVPHPRRAVLYPNLDLGYSTSSTLSSSCSVSLKGLALSSPPIEPCNPPGSLQLTSRATGNTWKRSSISDAFVPIPASTDVTDTDLSTPEVSQHDCPYFLESGIFVSASIIGRGYNDYSVMERVIPIVSSSSSLPKFPSDLNNQDEIIEDYPISSLDTRNFSIIKPRISGQSPF